MQLTPYLIFNGQCEAAFRFYEKCFGGKILMMQTHGEAPGGKGSPAHRPESIMHARLALGDQLLMGSDSPPEYYSKPGSYVSIGVDTPAEAERIYAELIDGGKAEMPLQQTFWAVRFAMLTDRYGTPWMINCEQAT